MDKRSITQEYYVLAVNENGYMPPMHRDESNAGLVVAGVMELMSEGIITIEKRKITVQKELPDELGYLSVLYEYLRQKVRPVDSLMSVFVASTGSRIRQLMEAVGAALLEKQGVIKTAGGFLGKKTVYVPEKACKEAAVSRLKAAVTKEGELSPCDVALISILKESKNLNQYFADFERDALKTKLKELKKNPGSRQMAEMINYVNNMTAIITTLIVTSMN